MSNSILHKLSIIPEVTYGTTPATPTFLEIPHTGSNLALAKNTMESGIISPTRQVTDVRHGNRQVGGDISCELLYGTFDEMLAALLGGAWSSNVLVPGVTRKSFSVLRQFTDIAGSGENFPFQLYKGVELNKLSLNITPESFVKADFSVFGRELALANTAPTDSTFTAAANRKPFDTFSGSVLVNGDAVANITEIQLSIENGIQPRFVLFDDKSNEPKIGKCRVTGTLTLYFADSALLAAFNGGDKRSLEFVIEDPQSNSYTFELPSILGTGAQTDVQGESDIMIPFPFTAIYERGAGTPESIKITRYED